MAKARPSGAPRRPECAIVIVALAALTVACDGATQVPTAPPQPAATLQFIAVNGLPPALAVDDTAQLEAVGTFSDGRTEAITAQVAWTAQTAACSVSASGLVTALAEGDCSVEAALGGVRSARSAAVGPSVTFSISGVVREKWGVDEPPIPGAILTLMNGPQAGRQTVADANGRFELSRLPKASVPVRAAAEGFDSNTADFSPGRATGDFALEPRRARVHRQFLNDGVFVPEIFVSFEQTFTVSRRGPVTVRARSDGHECGTYETYGMVLKGPSIPPGTWVYGCPAGVWAERTLILDPGRYKVEGFYALWPWTTARREMELLFPG